MSQAPRRLVLQPIEEGDPLLRNHDDRPFALEFPIYMFVRAEPQTPNHEIDVALIQDAFDLLPVFTEKEFVEAAEKRLEGDYRIQEFGKTGFIKFLRHVILPRHIEFLTFNPDVSSETGAVIGRIRVSDMIADLETDIPDEEIEKLIGEGKMKRI